MILLIAIVDDNEKQLTNVKMINTYIKYPMLRILLYKFCQNIFWSKLYKCVLRTFKN